MSTRGYQSSTINDEYGRHVSSARNRSLKPLRRADWEKVVFNPCCYCGKTDTRNVARKPGYNPDRKQPMDRAEEDRYSVSMNGVDRIDSSIGYDASNCSPCCRMCNNMKLDHSVVAFLSHAEKIHQYRCRVAVASEHPQVYT